MTLVKRMMWFDPDQTWKKVNRTRVLTICRRALLRWLKYLAGLAMAVLVVCGRIARCHRTHKRRAPCQQSYSRRQALIAGAAEDAAS